MDNSILGQLWTWTIVAWTKLDFYSDNENSNRQWIIKDKTQKKLRVLDRHKAFYA